MKTLKFTVLLLYMLIINSCTNKGETEQKVEEVKAKWEELDEEEQKVRSILMGKISIGGEISCLHDIFLSFQNVSGNDLVKGMNFSGYMTDPGGFVKDELYTLEYVLPHFQSDRMSLLKGKSFSKIFPELNGNYDYLYFAINNGDEKITIKLTCTHVFGDDTVHEIVTWWKKTERLGALCYRIEFGGKEYNKISYIYDDFGTIKDGLGGTEVIKIENYRTYSVATIILNR